jgi:hypothetical protein
VTTDQKPATQACYEAGCHDYTDPVVVRQSTWLFLLFQRAEVAIIFCRRCGAYVWAGWSEDETSGPGGAVTPSDEAGPVLRPIAPGSDTTSGAVESAGLPPATSISPGQETGGANRCSRRGSSPAAPDDRKATA